MKSIFILGASRLQLPAILKAKEKGLYVYVLDYDPNAVGIKYADKFLEISTIDKDAVYQAALVYKPDYIVTSTSDMPVRTVSWVCEKLGKKTDISYENAICSTDKAIMRDRMKEHNVPIPEYHMVSSLEEFLEVSEKMPDRYVLKPVDNAASRGVVLVDKSEKPDLKSLYEYCVRYSRNGNALVEEYMEGPEVSVESYSINGEPHIITVTDKIVTELPFFVELGHVEPSRLSPEVLEQVRNVAYSAIVAIGMQDGPTHTEIKITPTGVKLVEIAARLGGDFITSRLVPLSTGVDMIECSFASLLGEKVNCERRIDKGSAIRFLHGKNGILKAVRGIDEARSVPGIQEIEIYINPGDEVRAPENSSDRIGHVIATGDNAFEADQNARKALESIELEYEK